MGPDWWTLDFYRATATQMAKMKLNFWGFHSYPLGSGAGPEPLTWVGEPEDFDPATGAVLPSGAYASSWYLTQNFSRGNLPGSISRGTSGYCCGADLLFDRDCYGSPAQAGTCFPASPADAAVVLDDSAALLRGAFTWAASAGIDTAVGSEIPLTPPPGSSAPLQRLYEGIFARLAAAGVPASHYWLWTTEGVEDHSTGRGLPQSNPLWAQLVAEIAVARAARDAVAPNLTLGTNGWCLGPGDNASYFDAAVVGDSAFTLAAIDPLLGWGQVDPGFAGVTRHKATVIPWLEDDMGLAGAQLWVNRTLWHADDAARYGAAGLLGIHWRTFEASPQAAALAAAGWIIDSGSGAAAVPASGGALLDGSNLTAMAVYLDFCAAQFGADTAATCAALFLAVDGASDPASTNMATSRLPRGGQFCCGGPLGPAGEAPIAFLNTSGFEAWLPTVTGGAANVERAGRWVSLMLYHASMAEVSTAAVALQAAAAQVHDEASARQYGFPALAALSWAYGAMLSQLLAFAAGPGQLGMLAAHEGMNWPSHLLALAGPILPYTAACAPFDAALCVADNYTVSGRALPYTVTLAYAGNSREWCGAACVSAGYAWAGVEFGVACFCGSAPPAEPPLPVAQCGQMPCAGAPAEGCGGADIISVFPAACPPAPGAPPGLLPSPGYAGRGPRMFQPAPRTTVGATEGSLGVEVAVLAAQPPRAVDITWWLSGGGGGNTTAPLAVVPGRGVYRARVQLPVDTSQLLEYVVTAAWADGTALRVPVEGAQTVVVL